MTSAEAATLRFFEDATKVATLERLVESFGACASANGFQSAACVRLAAPGQPVQPRLLFSWGPTGWARGYVEARRHRYDPTIQAVFGALGPFSWDEVEVRAEGRDALSVFDGFRAAGARGGLVAPVHGPMGGVFSVTLVSETETAFSVDVRLRMHVAASLFAIRGLTFIEREADPPGRLLTRREIQCVFWVAEGKSDWEIGRILDISEETVAWHLQNAKAKLGVSRRAQLPAAAWRRGVLLDESLS